MNKKCECRNFFGVEEFFLKGTLEKEILYLKSTGDSGGIEDIRCVNCNKKIDGNYEIEIC
jgi:hypothetical protein